MASIAAVVPVPVAVGVGAAVSTLTMGATKTIIVDGVFVEGATLTVEVANIAGAGNFVPLQSFSAPGLIVVDVACNEMRCRVEGAALGAAVTCDVAGVNNGSAVLALNVPAADGVSAGVNIAALGAFKTAICISALPFAGSLTVEFSPDNTNYGSGMEAFTEPGLISKEIPALFARVRRQGFDAAYPGSPPTMSIAGSSDTAGT